jgi:usherin
VAGSLDQDCDINTGECNCKPFVTGTKCNQCVTGTSNLDIKNPFGCSQGLIYSFIFFKQ